jgi:hypothetical protein
VEFTIELEPGTTPIPSVPTTWPRRR